MRTVIVGAGPSGLFLAAALRRRGHAVVLVDRDSGPAADGSWGRRGVMQFRHAHLFRRQVAEALQAELPEAYAGWLARGAEPQSVPGGGGAELMGVRSQRETLERALREVVEQEPGLIVRHGHATEVSQEGGVATGVVVDGDEVSAELVIDASGRSGSVGANLPERASIGGPCGIAYVDRKYRLRPGAELGPLSHPMLLQLAFDGYGALVFPHERGIFSVVIVRSSADRDLMQLRHSPAYDAAAAAVPALAAWVDPERSEPVSDVIPGANLVNAFRSQLDTRGNPILDGLVWVGDSVATTTPTFGRGVAMAFDQCRALLECLETYGTDLVAVSAAFEASCQERVKPWVVDHIEVDSGQAARWDGVDVDLDERLPSDLVLEAGVVDPDIRAAAMPYLAMHSGPSSLDAVRPAAKAVYDTGWRPAPDEGPTRDELARIAVAAAAG